MDKEKTYLSREKYGELEQELYQLRNERRREIADRLDAAKSLGDLSENAEYHAAREEQAETEDRINELETILRQAEVVEGARGSRVMIGSRVTVRKQGQASPLVFELVGQEEADANKGKISHQSPLGQALFGHSVGEIVVVQTPRGEVKYRLVAVD